MKGTAIEWAENTINFYMGCTKVSEGCKNCYMFRDMPRFGKDPNILNHMSFDNIRKNLKKWKPSRIFVNSMSDTFHERLSDYAITEMFTIMLMNPQHQYLILTKRIERAVEFLNNQKLPDNFWIGTSVENERCVDRIEHLKKIKTSIRFVSFEPLLDSVFMSLFNGIQWVIVGGESDKNPRPMKKEWVDNIFKECQERGIPFFFKQWGGSKKCKCHNAWGCRIYQDRTWDELPVCEVVVC